MNLKKIALIIMGSIFAFFFCAIGSVIAFFVYIDYQSDRAWEEFLAYPLPENVIEYLCTRDLLHTSLGNCSNDNLIVQQRYVPEIFKLNLHKDATYKEVTDLFGIYEFYCEREPNNVSETYNCQYRLGSYDIILFFNKESSKIEGIITESQGS